MDILSYILSKKYTEDSIIGLGAIKGANCQIQSIVDNADGTHNITFLWKDLNEDAHTSVLVVANGETPTITTGSITGGHQVTFTTTNPAQSKTFNVMDGEDGISVVDAEVDASNHLILTLSEGSPIDCGEIQTATLLSGLDDVTIDTPTNGQILIYNSVLQKWVNGSPAATSTSLEDLSDLTINQPTDGQIITYDAEHNVWINSDNVHLITELDDIGIDRATLENGQMIEWSASAQKWINVAKPTIPDSADDISYDNTTSHLEADDVQEAIDELATTKADISALANVATTGDFDDLVDTPTTLSGYGITDAYTATETDNKITEKIATLDVTDTSVAGSYVTQVSETDGKISVVREAADVTPTENSTKMITSGGAFTALADKVDKTSLGASNGVAQLDAEGKLLSSQLPSSIDDIINGYYYDNIHFYEEHVLNGYYYNDEFYHDAEHTDKIIPVVGNIYKDVVSGDFYEWDDVNSVYVPTTPISIIGQSNKIYVDIYTNRAYRWSGLIFVEISESLALGITENTAYRGDRGKIAYDHSQLTSGNPHQVTKSEVGLGNVVNTGDSAIPTENGTTKFTTGGAYTELNKKYDINDDTSTDLDDTDYVPFYDVSTTSKKKSLWSNIKALLKIYFDTLYPAKATTLASYGITDAYTQTQINNKFEGVAPIEPTTTASEAHNIGSKFYLDGTLVEATANISANDTITIGTNVKLADDVETQVDSLKQTLSDFEDSITGEVVDSEPYVLRQGKGNLADMELVGGSLAWNQLIPTNAFSSTGVFTNNGDGSYTVNGTASDTVFPTRAVIVPIIANHKYLLSLGKTSTSEDIYIAINGLGAANYIKTAGIKSSPSDTNITLFCGAGTYNNVKIYPQAIDLTALFGSSTIADYIYSLEQATAGAGVAWFRKYFPNAYYGYQSGKIESVNVKSRKAVGFNQWDEQLEIGMYDTETGEKTGTTATLRNVNKIDVFPNTVYYCCSNILIRYLEYDANGKYLGTNTTTNTTFRTQKDTAYLNIQCGLNYEYICINISKTTGTPKNGDYVPYSGTEYPFANKQLRGIPKLVDNKLSFDGDIWKANEGITRKYIIVTYDGSEDELWQDGLSVGYIYITPTVAGKKPANNATKWNALCNYLEVKPFSNLYLSSEEGAAMSSSGNMAFHIPGVTDISTTMTAVKAYLASNPLQVCYELATPTTESATPFQNPQRAFIDGTEEFVDYGVQSATRDVSIPVGNNTTYQLNETLPPIEDYVDGAVEFKAAISALGTDESGRTTASRAYTTGEFFYQDGKMYKVLTSIAQGATFTINTNCQQTTLFAELKALAQ